MSMQNTPSSEHASRQRVSLTVSKALVEEAKQMKVNLSQTAEAALAAEVKKRKEAQWLEENAEFIAAYNKHIEVNGLAFKPIWELRAEGKYGEI